MQAIKFIMTAINIVFYDGASSVSYSAASLDNANNGIGGAEATLARVAIGLVSRGVTVTVVQPTGGNNNIVESGVRWMGFAVAGQAIAEADIIIVQRRIVDAWMLRGKNKRAAFFVWYHDWYSLRGLNNTGASFGDVLRNIAKSNARAFMHLFGRIKAIAVSETHKKAIGEYFKYSVLAGRVQRDVSFCQVIYNPISDSIIKPSHVDVNPNKLIFFSAPWKGLAVVKKAFLKLSQKIPELELHVASPSYGYEGEQADADSKIVGLGILTQAELALHVSSSLCVFYPSKVIPETFGLVFVESHALGTPVLAHAFGAAPEMLTDAELIDCTNDDEIFERISKWRAGGRPHVGVEARFTRANVLARWSEVLGLPAAATPE